MKESSGSPLVVNPTSRHTQTLVFLHGRGSNAERFAHDPSVPAKPGLLRAPTSTGQALPERLPGLKFVLPTAPLRRCTAEKRTTMHIWFDCARFRDPFFREELGVAGLAENGAAIRELLRKEAESVGWANVFLGGLSEGCAMAVHVFLSLDVEGGRLGGFVGWSGWLPFQETIEEIVRPPDQGAEGEEGGVVFETESGVDGAEDAETEEDAVAKVGRFVREDVMAALVCEPTALVCRRTPVFLGHGDQDEVVPVELGRRTRDVLNALGLDVSWKEYKGQGHWFKVSAQLDDLVEFIERSDEASGS